jgi:hypothetical protein
MEASQKNRILIVVIVASFVIIFIVGVFFALTNKSGDDASKSEYYDSNSKETISNPKGKTPEKYGGAGSQPIFLGLSALTKAGVSKYQLDATKQAYLTYTKLTKESEKEISISVDSVVHKESVTVGDKTREVIEFGTIFDRAKKYKTRLEYFDLTAIQLYLYNSEGKLVYDSKPIDVSTQESPLD